MAPKRVKQGIPWTPMRRAQQVISPALAARAAQDPVIADTIARSKEMWQNNQYTVIVDRFPEDHMYAGHVAHLSIRRNDRRAARDWRDFMRIKDEIAGEDAEGVELYPARRRLVDGANQYHLWCFPPGVILPIGFPEGLISDNADGIPGARQRPHDRAPASA